VYEGILLLIAHWQIQGGPQKRTPILFLGCALFLDHPVYFTSFSHHQQQHQGCRLRRLFWREILHKLYSIKINLSIFKCQLVYL